MPVGFLGCVFLSRPIAALLLAKENTSTAVVASAFRALLSCELHSLVATAMKDMDCCWHVWDWEY